MVLFSRSNDVVCTVVKILENSNIMSTECNQHISEFAINGVQVETSRTYVSQYSHRKLI